MSHPYWPQSYYLYRPGGRRSQAPVPASMAGFDDFAGDDYAGGRYEAAGTPAPRSWRRGVRTYGSMTPKYDYATPRYIRDEPAGMGYFGEDVGGCLGDLRKKLIDGILGVLSIPNICVPIVGCVGDWLGDAMESGLASLQNFAIDQIADPQKQRELEQAIVNFIMGLPDPPTWTKIPLTWKGAAAEKVAKKIVGEIVSCRTGGEAKVIEETEAEVHRKWCAVGETYMNEPVTPEQCAAWGVPYKSAGPMLLATGFVLPSAGGVLHAAVDPGKINQVSNLAAAAKKGLVQTTAQLSAQCAAAGGELELGTDPNTGLARYYCKPSPATSAACQAAGGQPTWDPFSLYKCVGAAAPGTAGGVGTVALVAGAAALALLLLRR